ncbi:MAG: ABC transporter permease [bacterium]|nr:ABC transporter permease [bacterium]
MYTLSKEHTQYIKKLKNKKRIILFFQIIIIILFLLIWQILSSKRIINTFLFSSPYNVYKCIIKLFKSNDLFKHVNITVYETITSFLISNAIGILISTILWWNNTIAKIIDPYLTIINSLPKVALGPLIIIWVGASTNSIIFMALMISSIISIINIYNAFNSTDKNFITLMKCFKASKWQIYKKVIIPSNILNIINTFKINISMSLIGVIMGELLVSKAGLGYLIMYGSQVFNIDLVITSVFILAIISYVMYYIIYYIEKKLTKNN